MKSTTYLDAEGHIDEVARAMIVDGQREESAPFLAALSHLEQCTHCGERVADAALESVALQEAFEPRRAKAPARVVVRSRGAAPAIAVGLLVALAASIPLWIDALASVPEDLRVARTVFVVTLRAIVSLSRSTDELGSMAIAMSTFAAVVFSTIGVWLARRGTRRDAHVVKVGGEA